MLLQLVWTDLWMRASWAQLSQAERNQFLPALDDTVSDDVLVK
jgi:hypothetical protein